MLAGYYLRAVRRHTEFVSVRQRKYKQIWETTKRGPEVRGLPSWTSSVDYTRGPLTWTTRETADFADHQPSSNRRFRTGNIK